jgi:hypothetical protein
MKLTDKQTLDHVAVFVGKDGAWVELKTKDGQSFLFQPIQEFAGKHSCFRKAVIDWANSVQSCYTPEECEHEWEELPDSQFDNETSTEVRCSKCEMRGERNEATGEVYWPAT